MYVLCHIDKYTRAYFSIYLTNLDYDIFTCSAFKHAQSFGLCFKSFGDQGHAKMSRSMRFDLLEQKQQIYIGSQLSLYYNIL